MRKIFTLFAALVCGLALNAKTLYLQPNANWTKDGARFAVYAFGSGEQWFSMSSVNGANGYYQADVDDKYPTVIFCRMNGSASENNWNNKWNQTQDMSIEDGKNLCVISDGAWDNGGSWSTYSQGGGGGDPITPQPSGAKDYYLKGYCNGKDITTPTAEELFENGTLTYTFTGDANGKGYFFILVCEQGQVVGDCYMAAAYAEGHCTLVKEDASHIEKLGVPAGTVTFYLYDNGDGSLELSIAPIEGKTLVGTGEGGGQGGGQGGGDPVIPDPQPQVNKDYYLKGYCNGKDITTPTAEELFEHGTLTYTFTGDANGKGYFFILVCEQGQVVGDCYMAAAYAEGHCTLVKEDASHIEKLGVPAGTVTFYLYDNGDGSLELSITPLEGKTLVGESSQGVENTFVNEKAHKTIVEGQLRIVRGDKIFDATGRQIQ